VTTVRSMGVPHFVDVGIRELAKLRPGELPEFLAAGYHVRPEPDAGFFIDFPEHARWLDDGVHTPNAVKQMAESQLERGIDWLKVNATARAGLPDTDPRRPYYDQAAIKALVAAGAAQGVPVAAHAHGDEGGRAAVLGGVKSIEHGTYLSTETLELMKERGTYLVPTLAVVTDLTEPGGDYDIPLLMMRGRHMLPRIRETARQAYVMGIPLIASTDTGYDKESTLRLGLELEEFVQLGMSNFEALQSATARAAEFLELNDHTGSLAEGMDADLLILELNPLENVGAVHDLLLIMNDGSIVVNRLEW